MRIWMFRGSLNNSMYFCIFVRILLVSSVREAMSEGVCMLRDDLQL